MRIIELREKIEKTENADVTEVTFLEWLDCYNELIEKINADDPSYSYERDINDLLFVEVLGLDEETEKKYQKYCSLIRTFDDAYRYAKSNAYNNYTASPKAIWTDVLQGKAKIDQDPPEYRPLR